ncbi:hypothetical protein CKM354_000033600 [Cercospora kikuchii]|uniref:Metallo-beta-lactamase domain-containing protein n=1 Tax=Cercospora kikuchii TaxID=84275 RepID=A0A9P3FBS4_9PEZI|nr:uncharacterized protein CKM354_000033600 [Cercospora kikuchii]GIZ36870.1 hypothetical protein CKM354_000033600 [Cercospora kikuchii]
MSELRAAVFVAKPVPIRSNSFVPEWSPTSCTLIYDKTNAILVDTAITIAQNQELVSWILKIAPGRRLEAIYITHGHPDHWFGLPIVLKQFPKARVLGTERTIKHGREEVEGPAFSQTWGAWFWEEEIPKPYVFPELLPPGNKFSIGNKYECEAIEVGHSDTHDTTVLWIPDLKLVVAEDVVYGQVHQMLAIGTKPEQRAEWLRALDIVENLKPIYVVAGHQQAEEMHGPWTIASTRQYIKDFEKVLERVVGRGGSAEEAHEEMMKLHGERMNPMVLKTSFFATFAARDNKPSATL